MSIITQGLASFNFPGISESHAAIRTYSNYSAAWCLWTDTNYTLREAQYRLKAFSRLQPTSLCDLDSVRQHLLRGNLTLKLIQDIPVDEQPDFAITSALWLPVQTYYAVHGFGMALLAAKYGARNLPQTHGAFMRQAAECIVRHLFPSPFCAVLQNGFKGYPHLQPELINISDVRMYIDSGLNLERPNETTRDAHIAQCLDTTRRRLIGAKLDKEREKARKPGKKYGVLKKQRQIEIARTVSPTTVLDYLYRTRVKSNYEDPTMYHEGSDDMDAVLELVRNTQKLATTVCAFIAAILWQTADNCARDQLNEEVKIDSLIQSLEKVAL